MKLMPATAGIFFARLQDLRLLPILVLTIPIKNSYRADAGQYLAASFLYLY